MPNLNFAQDLEPRLDRSFVSPQPVPASDLKFHAVKTPGGSPNLAVAGSLGSPVACRYTVPGRGKAYMLLRARFVIRSTTLRPDRLIPTAALANGILISIRDAQDNVVFGQAVPFRTFADLLTLAGGEVTIWSSFFGGSVFAFEWPVDQLGIVPLLAPGESFEVLIRDDLTTLTDFKVVITGRMVRI